MNSFSEAIRFLYGLQKSGMKFGLLGIRTMLRSIGDPHELIPCIHIAGTNGKGSTASMLAAVYTASGYKTGLYTSPHLATFAERVRINGKVISRRALVELTNRLKKPIAKTGATFFEATTALAFRYFADKKVDIAIIETGLGGRLDATNVMRPLASVITNISLEHTQILGGSLKEIAFEKAGIIKPGVPCVTAVESRAAMQVIRKTCRSLRAPLFVTEKVRVRVKESTLNGSVADVLINGAKYSDLKVSLCGLHQLKNAALALLTLGVVARGGVSVSEPAIRRGLSQVQRLSGLSSRLSLLSRSPFILTDVAHNPAAMRELAGSLIELRIKNVILVFGVMKDKDYRAIIRETKRLASVVIAVTPSTERARASSDLVPEFRKLRIEVLDGGTVQNGIREALHLVGRKRPMVITGSHFVVGEAIASFQGRKYLTINQ